MLGPGRLRRTLWVMVFLGASYFFCHLFIFLSTDASETKIDRERSATLGSKELSENPGRTHDAKDRVVVEGPVVVVVEKTNNNKRNLPPPTPAPVPSSPLLVLILSSNPRSGSTFLTDLLTNVRHSITFFEPLWILQRKPECLEDPVCAGNFLREVFTCSFDADFENWLKSKNLFFQYFSDGAKVCTSLKGREASDCKKRMNLRHDCASAPIRFMKVIRARLGWLERLLEDPSLNLKIIHLTRDPRGAINSIRKFKWNKDPFSRCSDLENDLVAFDTLRKKFPSRLLQVQYEELCIRPEEVTSNMLAFITGDPSLTDKIRSFLTNHTTNTVKDVMSTFKDSKKQFEAFRYQIPAGLLENIEREPTCISSIKRLRHTVFGSKKNAENSSIPLFLESD